jgi:RNA polymerase sigma-70 factor (ECF subfamily)
MAWEAADELMMAGLMSSLDTRPAAADPLLPLVARARAGDADAFEALMAATEERVLRLAGRLLGDRELARDAAQEVFLRVYRFLGGFRDREDFRAWLYRITVNVCRDAGRRTGRPGPRVPLEGREPADDGPGSEEALLSRERIVAVRAALETLSADERAAIVLRDLEGLTSEEAAAVLGSRPGTVRARIASARTKLRQRLSSFAAPGARS